MMESLNNPFGLNVMLFALLALLVFVPLVLILCNPLLAGLIGGFVAVGCCELGEAYGWWVAGPVYGFMFVFLMALANSKFSSR